LLLILIFVCVFHSCTYLYEAIGGRQTYGSLQVSGRNKTSSEGDDWIHGVLQERCFTILGQTTRATADFIERYLDR